MVSVTLKGVSKRFANVVAVDNVSLSVNEGEFYTFLGPSGCGKTTTLRLIAGFYEPDEGEIHFNGRLMNRVPPNRRNTGMVFQTYALFPHMTIEENVAYGLRCRKVPEREARKRVEEALKLAKLEGLEKRFPSQLSGGQQQRAALARALVIEPDVLLLDEPLSNLDAKLRVEMRNEIRRIQKRLGITTIYVTHDQEEALTISDRLAIMRSGHIEQVGPPREVYERPASLFAADFMGVVNLIKARLEKIDLGRNLALLRASDGSLIEAYADGKTPEGHDVYLAIRPEALTLAPPHEGLRGPNLFKGRMRGFTYHGSLMRFEVESDLVEGGRLRVDVYNPTGKPLYREGEVVAITFGRESVHMLQA